MAEVPKQTPEQNKSTRRMVDALAAAPDDSHLDDFLHFAGEPLRKIVEAESRARDAEYRADHDSKTGLFTQEVFDRTITDWANSDGNLDVEGFLVVLDINGLKELNDKYGHHIGDRAIIGLAQDLQNPEVSGLREDDVIARSNRAGDEFLLFLPQREVILDHTEESEIGDAETQLAAKLEQLNNFKSRKNNFAMGIVRVTRAEVRRKGIDYFIKIADSKMYGDKERMKAIKAA